MGQTGATASSSSSPFCRPQVAATVSLRRGAWAGWQQRFQRVDRALLDAVPAVGRYGWETVIVLQR